MNQSELLQSKVVEAHDELWRTVVRLRGGLPAPYDAVLSLWFTILTPQELVAMRGRPQHQFSTQDTKWLNLVKGINLDLIRPYIDENLWSMARGRIGFAFRLLMLFSTDNPTQTELTNWPEDRLIVQNLLTTFSQEELERFSYSTPGTFRNILDLWDSRILAEIKKGLFD